MAKFLNAIIISATAWFLCFCWIFTLSREKTLSFVLATCLAVGSFCLIRLLDKNKKQKPTKSQINQKNKMDATSLAFCDGTNSVKELLAYKNFELEEKDGLYATKDGTTYFVVTYLGFAPFDCQALANAFKKAKPIDNLLVFCLKASPDVCDMAHLVGINLVLYQQKEVLALFDSCKVSLPKLKTKPKPKIFYYMFNKNRFWQWFGSAFFLSLASWASPFGTWLLTWATITFVISIFCLFNKRFNQVEKSLL